jgi:transcriptional regulator with PAS, ATPase and Fis domain
MLRDGWRGRVCLGSLVESVNTIRLGEKGPAKSRFDQIIGNSPALEFVLSELERVAPTDSTVLILGETGTGKELVARAVHNLSARCGRPFIKLNCAAISFDLLESELLTVELCSWTKSEICLWLCSLSCSGCFKSRSSSVWGVAGPIASMCV